MHHLCKLLCTTPDDDRIQEMDSVTKLWYYYNWMQDTKDQVDMLQQQSILTGSFWNPEAAKKMLESSQFKSSDNEFEDLSDKLKNNPNELNDIAKFVHSKFPSESTKRRLIRD